MTWNNSNKLYRNLVRNLNETNALLEKLENFNINLDNIKRLFREDMNGIKDFDVILDNMNTFFKVLMKVINEREQLKAELKIAEQIQETLIPDEAPEIEGFDIYPYFKAARVVSGDYYDFIPISNNLMGLTIADVSGKGLPGSLVMSMVRSVLRFESRQNPFPSMVLREVCKVIAQDLRPGIFITMVYAILNTVSKSISMVSAGHNPVLLYRSSEEEIQELKPKGVGIGIGDEKFFEKHLFEEKFFLQSGDILFFYTDGLNEAMNEKDEEFGLEKVKDIILQNAEKSSKKIIEIITEQVDKFRGDALQNDDITLLCLKTK